MLQSLSVSNYILIGSLETSFPEGLSIISGETGAGKSILLGALALVLGSKSDASMIGPSGDTCVVEARFGTTPAIRDVLSSLDLPADEDSIILRRVLSKSGRSRCFIDDEPVSTSSLQELASHLVDIHSQHQTLMLRDQAFRQEVLDLYAGAQQERKACADARERFLKAGKLLEATTARMEKAMKEEDYNRALWEKLDQAALNPGELACLEAEQEQLSHAEELKETLSSAEGLLSGEDNSPALSLVQARKLLEKAGRFIPSMQELSQRLEAARLEIDDIVAEVSSANERLDVSPRRLEFVEERLSLLYSLMRKHGVGTEEELVAVRDSLGSLVADASSLEEEVERLKGELSAAAASYDKAAEKLHEKRAKAAAPFAEEIGRQLHSLDLDHSQFKVELVRGEDTASGRDTVNFLFSSTGKNLQEVGKAASGGELSRVMLCLKACMARFRKMPTLVFDEIDSGVSGSTADKVGALICSMGADMQIFAITHLPQVAAKGSAHFLVSKKDDSTSMRRLSREERVMEIARMLSGAVITPEAIENAKTLLA
ncbi:MAG: DNA repair protein RecN [Bacteroidales bacterium]|nr:DNA repair protein RecN [Bacteroidales bacterium]